MKKDEIVIVMINLDKNTMVIMDKWADKVYFDLNVENFPKWVDLNKMEIVNVFGDRIEFAYKR